MHCGQMDVCRKEEQDMETATYLKALLGDLGLGGGNGGRRVGVGEAAAELAVLELGALGGADAEAAAADLSAAGTTAVGIGDASTGGELLGLAVADIGSTGGVGGKGHDGDGDYKWVSDCHWRSEQPKGRDKRGLTSQSSSESDANHIDGWRKGGLKKK